MESIDFPFTFDEMPLAGKFIYDSFVVDQQLFVELYPVFDKTFENRFYGHIQKARELVCCSSAGQKLQNERDRIKRNMDNLNSAVIQARNENVDQLPKVFEEFEDAIRREALNEMVICGKSISQYLEDSNNLPQISNQTRRAIISLLELLELDRLELKRLLHSRGLLTQEVYRSLNHLWATMQDVMEIGKCIHQHDNLRIQEYQIENISKRLKTYRSPMQEML